MVAAVLIFHCLFAQTLTKLREKEITKTIYFISTTKHYVMYNFYHVITACSEDTHDAEN